MDKVTITKIDSDAKGVARIDDRPVIVDKVLYGEEIEIYSKISMGKYDLAKQYKVITASEDRIDAPCPYYDLCGGCALQHSIPEFQKRFKINKVKESFRHICNKNIKVSKYVESDKEYGYRNKMVFAVRDYRCGMYENNSKDFIEIDACELATGQINCVYTIVAEWIYRNKVKLNHIALRDVNNKICIILIGETKPKINALIKTLNIIIKGEYQVVFNKNTAFKDLITDDIEILYGDNLIMDYLNIKYEVSPNSFMQINDFVSKKLYEKVATYVKGEIIINAYSGAGLLTAILSKKAKEVYGVEVVKNAHTDAEKLKKSNKITNMYNICGKAEECVPEILKEKNATTIILDPPRKGVDKEFINILNNNAEIKNIIYIACSPNSLARDINMLTNYEIKEVTLYDMFPQTSHIETLLLLEKK